MVSEKLKWCFKQRKGIKLVEPNDNLSREYFKSAEETLAFLRDAEGKSNMWLATLKYYCEYFAVYGLLMKLGIKSEIHDCTIEICKFLEHHKILPEGTAKLLEEDKELRIDNQYYLKNRKVDIDFNSLRDFVLMLKNIANSITSDEIYEIRAILSEKKS